MSSLSPELSHGPTESFWSRFAETLKKRIDPSHFETWLARVLCRSQGKEQLELIAPNGFTRDWIRRHYLAQFEEAARLVDGVERRVRILQIGDIDAESLDGLISLGRAVPGGSAGEAPPAVPLKANGAQEQHDVGLSRLSLKTFPVGPLDTIDEQPDAQTEYPLASQFVFEEFVTDRSNELAYASARAVAEFPGGPYNPLFIHGSSGLGKTHLLQAICHAVLRGPNPRKLLYLSCETFVNQFIQAVTNGDLEPFRYRYRKLDILLIDDIQFLEGKTRTQEEFFHTFNTLYNARSQIVLSSDRPPSAIETLQERLVSRFRWGMVTCIEPPSLETRVAILQRKARLWGVELPQDVAQCLAENIDTNIRELEGAVTKVIGYANLIGRKLDLETVYGALQDLLPQRAQITVQQVLEAVSKEFGIPAKELQSKRRIKSVVVPRHIGIYLARQHTRMSLEEIGGFFGGRDHSTVLHSIKKGKAMIAEDPEMSERVRRLSGQLERG